MKQIAEVMTLDLRTLPIDATIAEAYDVMQTLHCRHVPIVYEGNVVGIISDRDILLRATDNHGEVTLPPVPISALMSRHVEVCLSTDSICDVARRMVQLRFDSMPVLTTHGALLGIVTSTDLLLMLSRCKDVDDPHIGDVSHMMMVLGLL